MKGPDNFVESTGLAIFGVDMPCLFIKFGNESETNKNKDTNNQNSFLSIKVQSCSRHQLTGVTTYLFLLIGCN